MERSNVSGLVLVNKDEGMTSQTVVNRAKRLFGADKAGHTGTLDPMATGVLPVLLGRAVKASEFLLTSRKHYRATLLLGTETDTEDITGEVLRETDEIPCERTVYEAAYSMIGEGMQIPPMYSAIRVGGRRLMELAREGKTVEREARPITVYKLEARRTGERTYELDVECSKGTYIRTLCADIGRRLGCYGCMKTLERSEVSIFTLRDAKRLSEFENMKEEERNSYIIPVEKIFSDFMKVTLPPFFARLARCGQPIYTKKLGLTAEVGERVKFYDENGFFAIGEAMLIDGETVIKPIRQFDI